MQTNGITLLGLGPGNPQWLTLQASEMIKSASEIYVRTDQHPAVDGFPATLQIHSFDYLFEIKDSMGDINAQIVAHILTLGQRPGGVIYAVPGHPLIAESTCPEIIRCAAENNIPVQIIESLSFLEPVYSCLGVNILPHTTMLDALQLATAHHPPFPPDQPVLIAQIDRPQIAVQVKAVLLTTYPHDHRVQLVHGAGTDGQLLEDLSLAKLDCSVHLGPLSTLYLPPLGPATSLEAFQEIVAHLRAPDGCPWDREQTHQSLRPNLLEETYELVAALDDGDSAAMAEEFGDLLLQIVLHAQIASENGAFNFADIVHGIHTKIVHRHPHVFGDLSLEDADTVIKNWEKIKAEERKDNGNDDKGLLDGVAKAMPSLVQAETFQKRAARVGFDWSNIQGVLDKIPEEILEIQNAPNQADRVDEFGDLLFALVNWARWYNIDAESALRSTNRRFRTRFSFIEKTARKQGRNLEDLSLHEMDSLWDAAKHL